MGKLYHDILNTEKIQRPPTIVVVPRNNVRNSFLIDVRYPDFTGTLDIPVDVPDTDCYIVPPYKPLMFAGFQAESTASFDVYTLRGNNIIHSSQPIHSALHFPPKKRQSFIYCFIVESDSGNASDIEKTCPGLDLNILSKCKVMGPPVSYDLPVHPFFLTASRKVVKINKQINKSKKIIINNNNNILGQE